MDVPIAIFEIDWPDAKSPVRRYVPGNWNLIFPPVETDMKADVPDMVIGLRVNEKALPFASFENGALRAMFVEFVRTRPPIDPSAPLVEKMFPWTTRLPVTRTFPALKPVAPGTMFDPMIMFAGVEILPIAFIVWPTFTVPLRFELASTTRLPVIPSCARFDVPGTSNELMFDKELRFV